MSGFLGTSKSQEHPFGSAPRLSGSHYPTITLSSIVQLWSFLLVGGTLTLMGLWTMATVLGLNEQYGIQGLLLWHTHSVVIATTFMGVFLLWTAGREFKKFRFVQAQKKLHPFEPWRWTSPRQTLLVDKRWYRFFQYQKWGHPELELSEYPFFIGKKIQVLLRGLPPRQEISELKIYLRCLGQHSFTTGVGKNRRTHTHHYELHKIESQVDPQSLQAQVLKVLCQLPEDRKLGTDLLAKYPIFWMLEVHAVTRGVDFKASFQVPVYSAMSAAQQDTQRLLKRAA